MKHSRHTRVRIIYVILLILILITILPLWFFGSRMGSMNQDVLQRQENVLQTITSQSIAQFISLYMDNLNQQLKEFFDAVVPLATQIPAAQYSTDPRLRVALEGFVAERPAVLYATVLNNQARELVRPITMLPAIRSCASPWIKPLLPPSKGRSTAAILSRCWVQRAAS